MEATKPLIDLSAFLPLAIVVFVLWSIYSLYDAVFGGGNPLTRNTLARIEAGDKPENVYERWQQHRRQKRINNGCLLMVLLIAFVILAPTQARNIAVAVVSSMSEITNSLQRISDNLEFQNEAR
jgi:hypothetical protein